MLFFAPDPELKGAACVDLPEPEKRQFFSKSGNGYKKAQKVCSACPVWQRCLEKALDFERGLDADHRTGVWGGLNAAERYRLDLGAA